MTVTTILLLLVVIAGCVWYYRSRTRQHTADEWIYPANGDPSPVPPRNYKSSSAGFKGSHHDYKGPQLTPVMVDNMTELSACDVMMETRPDWRDSRPSNILGPQP
uniref:Secreted protein n=1 Tax=Achlya hypogyna TaxID=1202772 RepID=A0A0A7CMD0_ACHHY|nr:secreted protein [Achlya hypogyna]